MMSKAYTNIGTIIKAHGIGGEVAIKVETGLESVFDEHQVFYLYDKKMDYYPARAESIRLVSKAGQDLFFVKFDSIGSRTDAETLKGRSIYLPGSIDPETPLSTDVTGYEVIDTEGTSFGRVIDCIDNPGHELLKVSSGTGSFLIPVVDAYILDVDVENGRILAQNIHPLTEI